jgi:anti-sigma B factor antagonist
MTAEDPIHSTRGFRVHFYQTDSALVVECHGKLTSENAPMLRDEVRARIAGQKRILVDMKDVPFMDSSGLGTIAGLYVTARTRGCKLDLCNSTKQIHELFRMSNLLGLFEPVGRCGGRMM